MPAIARNGYLYGASPQVPIDAEDVRYDNSTSELESTDVQSAIGELKELIDEGGGPQVQSDWTETDTSSDAYIQHKPTLGTASSKDSTTTISEGGTALPTAGSVYTALSGKVDVEAGKGLSSNDYTDTEKTKLAGIASGAEVNVQSNWNESNTSSDAYIQNKPTLGSAASKDVPTSGNASTTEVVMGSDTRLSDARNAADVYSWAKAETKPSYTANEVGAIASTEKGANGGVAELDSTGKIFSSQLPSYVDDVLEYDSLSDFPLTGESGKVYVAKDTNVTYRWSGTTYVKIGSDLTLGETSSTAYRGDRGKAAYDHSQVVTGNPHNVTKSDVGLGNVTNDKQMTGLASGATEDHVIVFGADGYTPKDSGKTIGASVPSNAVFTDTTYSAASNSGITLNSSTNEFSNSGVRSVAQGSTNGTVSVNTNGTTADVAVKGLQNSAYNNTFVGTLNEWNALTTEQQKAYDEYKITDDYVEPTNPDAEDIGYDNTTSGLLADDVQDAIDEVNSLLSALGLSVVNGEVVQTVIEEV